MERKWLRHTQNWAFSVVATTARLGSIAFCAAPTPQTKNAQVHAKVMRETHTLTLNEWV